MTKVQVSGAREQFYDSWSGQKSGGRPWVSRVGAALPEVVSTVVGSTLRCPPT
jgi:hypothetical protein